MNAISMSHSAFTALEHALDHIRRAASAAGCIPGAGQDVVRRLRAEQAVLERLMEYAVSGAAMNYREPFSRVSARLESSQVRQLQLAQAMTNDATNHAEIKIEIFMLRTFAQSVPEFCHEVDIGGRRAGGAAMICEFRVKSSFRAVHPKNTDFERPVGAERQKDPHGSAPGSFLAIAHG